jgi:hypothetical protein
MFSGLKTEINGLYGNTLSNPIFEIDNLSEVVIKFNRIIELKN